MATTSVKHPTPPTSEAAPQKRACLFAPRRDDDRPQSTAKVDPTYGQRGAFPGLEDDEGEGQGLFYGPADDGLAYLRMVRLEAKGVPNLLVAPSIAKSPKGKDLYAPYEPKGEGFYSDGAYVAISLGKDVNGQYEDSEIDPQEAYYVALLERFEGLRSTLSTAPPSSAPQIDQAVRPLLGRPKTSSWKHALLKSQPTPTLLCSIPNGNVIFGIEVLESLLTMKNLNGGMRHRLGAWAWGLLGRCRGVSEMDSEDVSVLRGLGKKACALLRRIRAGEEVNGDHEDGGIKEDENEIAGKMDTNGDFGGNGGDEIDNEAINAAGYEYRGNGDEKLPESAAAGNTTLIGEIPGENSTSNGQPEETSLEEARTRLLAGLSSADRAPSEDRDDAELPDDFVDQVQVSDAHATLDMIVTLVGECYGQRDLLDARLAWEEL